MSTTGTSGGKLLWQVLAGLAIRQTLGKLLQVLAAAILGVAATYFAMAYIENHPASAAIEQPVVENAGFETESTAEPLTESAGTDVEPQREKSVFERALVDGDTSVRIYLIRYTCGHHGFYSPDPAECRDYKDVIRQVEYLNQQPCPDCS
jgi:hypothetical protein